VGNVIKEFENTLDPDGLVETRWVHGGPYSRHVSPDRELLAFVESRLP